MPSNHFASVVEDLVFAPVWTGVREAGADDCHGGDVIEVEVVDRHLAVRPGEELQGGFAFEVFDGVWHNDERA